MATEWRATSLCDGNLIAANSGAYGRSRQGSVCLQWRLRSGQLLCLRAWLVRRRLYPRGFECGTRLIPVHCAMIELAHSRHLLFRRSSCWCCLCWCCYPSQQQTKSHAAVATDRRGLPCSNRRRAAVSSASLSRAPTSLIRSRRRRRLRSKMVTNLIAARLRDHTRWCAVSADARCIPSAHGYTSAASANCSLTNTHSGSGCGHTARLNSIVIVRRTGIVDRGYHMRLMQKLLQIKSPS